MSKQSKSKSKKKSKGINKKMVLVAVGMGSIAAVLTAVTIIVFNKDNSVPEKTLSRADASVNSSKAAPKDPLLGTWEYADGTRYRFSEGGKGAMIVEKFSTSESDSSNRYYEYVYSYTTDGVNLSIDYEKPEVYDAKYTYEVRDGVLHMVGGDGTAGGEYDMSRVS